MMEHYIKPDPLSLFQRSGLIDQPQASVRDELVQGNSQLGIQPPQALVKWANMHKLSFCPCDYMSNGQQPSIQLFCIKNSKFCRKQFLIGLGQRLVKDGYNSQLLARLLATCRAAPTIGQSTIWYIAPLKDTHCSCYASLKPSPPFQPSRVVWV